ncbi:MAG: hypothetical protein R3236_10335, partial [Phycisphaeraceae bacterium]|nr:hypothetical protein [Phycisphaeraceae bacterium]
MAEVMGHPDQRDEIRHRTFSIAIGQANANPQGRQSSQPPNLIQVRQFHLKPFAVFRMAPVAMFHRSGPAHRFQCRGAGGQ